MGLGSGIRDPESGKKTIPDPGSGSRVKKAPDPGSGSATLIKSKFFKQNLGNFFAFLHSKLFYKEKVYKISTNLL